MKIKTNPTSKAYSYCWVEGLTVTVVIDETADMRTVRIATDYDPSIDPRMFNIIINGLTVAVGSTQVGGGGGSGRKRTPADQYSGAAPCTATHPVYGQCALTTHPATSWHINHRSQTWGPSTSAVTYSDGEIIVERSAAAIAACLRDQPHADFSGEGPSTVITAAADLLEELQARIDIINNAKDE